MIVVYKLMTPIQPILEVDTKKPFLLVAPGGVWHLEKGKTI
jgi:hypothetical protein